MKIRWLCLPVLLGLAFLAFACAKSLPVTMTVNVDATSQKFPLALYDGGKAEVNASDEVAYRFDESSIEENSSQKSVYLTVRLGSDQDVPRTVSLNLRLSQPADLSEGNILEVKLVAKEDDVYARAVTFVAADGSEDRYSLGGNVFLGTLVSGSGTRLEVDLVKISRQVLVNLQEIRLDLHGSGTVQLMLVQGEK